MGRVTIFSIDDCPFCSKAKSLLQKHEVDYYEINLDEYPDKRRDMLKLAGVLSVPQIFFNEEHVGGASELIALETAGTLSATLQKLMQENNGSAEEDNSSSSSFLGPELMRPDTPPTPKPKASPRTAETVVENGTVTVVEAGRDLEQSRLGKSFAASKLVSWIMEKYRVEGREAALAVANAMLDAGLVEARGDAPAAVKDSAANKLWVSNHKQAGLLNGFRKWQDRVDEPMVVVVNLKKQLGKVVSKHRDSEGLVDYIAVCGDEDFAVFDEASCELQGIDLAAMDVPTRIAFCINLYNMAITHAYVKVGAPKSTLERVKFFPNVGYNVGGHFYSFDDIEHGVLRANKVLTKKAGPIPPGDPRLASVLPAEEMTPLIHTALNCGAKSCPPVKKFSAEAVYEELDIVAKSFFMQEDNLRVEGNTVHLNKILNWYAVDFGSDKFELLRTVSKYVNNEQAEQIEKIVENGTAQVKYNKYDWSNDAKRSRSSKVGAACSIQ